MIRFLVLPPLSISFGGRDVHRSGEPSDTSSRQMTLTVGATPASGLLIERPKRQEVAACRSSRRDRRAQQLRGRHGGGRRGATCVYGVENLNKRTPALPRVRREAGLSRRTRNRRWELHGPRLSLHGPSPVYRRPDVLEDVAGSVQLLTGYSQRTD